jgi:hypothetical protein
MMGTSILPPRGGAPWCRISPNIFAALQQRTGRTLPAATSPSCRTRSLQCVSTTLCRGRVGGLLSKTPPDRRWRRKICKFGTPNTTLRSFKIGAPVMLLLIPLPLDIFPTFSVFLFMYFAYQLTLLPFYLFFWAPGPQGLASGQRFPPAPSSSGSNVPLLQLPSLPTRQFMRLAALLTDSPTPHRRWSAARPTGAHRHVHLLHIGVQDPQHRHGASHRSRGWRERHARIWTI